jgi:biopolymer transport protein ExbB
MKNGATIAAIAILLLASPLVAQERLPATLREVSPWFFLAKWARLKLAQWQLNAALGRISAVRALSEAQLATRLKRNVIASLLAVAVQRIRLSAGSAVAGGITERAASRLSEIVRAEARAARQGMVVLGTIAATAPFVGLFGAVWGIMNSFVSISNSQTMAT